MQKLLSPKQVARAIGVSESSLKRWCDRGVIRSVRTAGGHRRLPTAAVMDFLRQARHELVRPERLGLPSNTGRGGLALERAAGRLCDALVAGDEDVCRQVAFDLFLAGHSTAAILDRAVAPAFHQIGDLWQCSEVEIYRERRACQIGLRLIDELRLAIVEPDADAPLAIGGAQEADPYSLPTIMAEVVLREAGYRATSLGGSLPFSTLGDAISQLRPRVFWLSVSAVADPETFLHQYAGLYEAAAKHDVAVAVGGRALAGSLRQAMQYAAFCDNFQHLRSFVASLDASSGMPRRRLPPSTKPRLPGKTDG